MIRLSIVAAAIAAASLSLSGPAAADPQSDLIGMLPAGYRSDSCAPVAAPVALAAVTRNENSLSGGPTSSRYWLFADETAMYEAFNLIVSSSEWTPVICPFDWVKAWGA